MLSTKQGSNWYYFNAFGMARYYIGVLTEYCTSEIIEHSTSSIVFAVNNKYNILLINYLDLYHFRFSFFIQIIHSTNRAYDITSNIKE